MQGKEAAKQLINYVSVQWDVKLDMVVDLRRKIRKHI